MPSCVALRSAGTTAVPEFGMHRMASTCWLDQRLDVVDLLGDVALAVDDDQVGRRRAGLAASCFERRNAHRPPAVAGEAVGEADPVGPVLLRHLDGAAGLGDLGIGNGVGESAPSQRGRDGDRGAGNAELEKAATADEMVLHFCHDMFLPPVSEDVDRTDDRQSARGSGQALVRAIDR